MLCRLAIKLVLISCVFFSWALKSDENDDSHSNQSSMNFVLIMVDDLGFADIGEFGNEHAVTPNLDQLAREGQQWTNFYSTSPVCSPSRGALLTGQYPIRSGLYGKRIPVLFPNDSTTIPKQIVTLPEALKSRGYETALFGKWHLGDSNEGFPTRHGFDYWYGIPYSNDMNWASAADFNTLLKLIIGNDPEKLQSELALRNRLLRNPKSDYWLVPLIRSEIKKESFVDTVLQKPIQQPQMTSGTTDEVIRFIEKHGDENPFFAFVTYAMPHVPLFTSESFDDSTGKGIYTDVVAELDYEIGRIKQTLKRLRIDESTLLIFTSDNGPWLAMGDHGGSAGDLNNGKGTTFEGGVRVPTIFWSPEKITPAVIDDIGLSIDFFKTLLGLSGKDTENMEVNIATDSIDLSATLLSNESDIRDEFVYYHQGEIRAMRVGNYKAHFITQGAYNQPPEREVHATPLLFDLSKDPGETKNIASQFPEILKLILERRAAHENKMTIAEPLFDNRLKQLN